MTKKYCSIDLEFTGFDPEKEQILEIGFAFFEAGKNGFEVTETWSQVFKPTIEVHPKILGLTGITQAEIDSAPSIADYRDFLSEKLSDVVLVAHNPILDIKFLELAGVKLSGQSVDTMELVQFLLPTHHSYNLENLMHYFGIKHTDSHRALADCLSTISLLEKMISIHAGFSEPLVTEIRQVLEKGYFSWAELLDLDFKLDTAKVNDSVSHGEFAQDIVADFELPVMIDKENYLHESRVANTLAGKAGEWLVAMQSKQEVLRLWQAGLVEGVFQAKDLFDLNAFEKFKKNASTPEELRFILKILVWLNTNWQTKTVLDLNVSFFGGQFTSYITGGKYKLGKEKVLACDYDTLTFLCDQSLETNRQLLVLDMQGYEKFLTYGSSSRMSWNYFSYLIRSIYNPETDYGQKEHKDIVLQALTSVDLFFGLVQLILRQNLKQLDYIDLSDLESLYSVFYNRIFLAAQNLSDRLIDLGKQVQNETIVRVGDNLINFFRLENNFVKWLELTEDNVVLHSQPIEIKQLSKQMLEKFSNYGFTETLVNKELLFYLVERFGLDTEIKINSKNYLDIQIEEADIDSEHPESRLLQLSKEFSPIALVFGSTSDVKEFYKKHYLSLGQDFKVLAQDYSGSGNKIFRNFKIFPNSLLLATSPFINRQKYRVFAGCVIYLSWPSIDRSHPYIRALLSSYESSFPNLDKILARNQFVLNLKQLSGPKVPKIFCSPEARQQIEK